MQQSLRDKNPGGLHYPHFSCRAGLPPERQLLNPAKLEQDKPELVASKNEPEDREGAPAFRAFGKPGAFSLSLALRR
jgi:hypothetical protein